MSEVTALKSLCTHPNVLHLILHWIADDDVYIATDLWPGGDLLSYLRNNGYINSPIAARYTAQLLGAVVYMHALGWVHRDIKVR